MFNWFGKKRLLMQVRQAEEYVQQHYVEAEKQENSSLRIIHSDDSKQSPERKTIDNEVRDQGQIKPDKIEVKFSRSINYENSSKASVKDNYDGRAIQRTIRNMSAATPTDVVLRALENSTDMTFVDKLLEHIDKCHMKDSEIYHAAQIDRRLFSKIITDRDYKPAKDTCIAFAFALELTIEEAEDLLSRAGYTLSHSNKRDVLLEYFFKEKIYNLFDINDILFRLGQKAIGRF